jgi:hypothetical protein
VVVGVAVVRADVDFCRSVAERVGTGFATLAVVENGDANSDPKSSLLNAVDFKPVSVFSVVLFVFVVF